MKVDVSEEPKEENTTAKAPQSVKNMIDPAELAAQAMSEAATTPKPLVETKA